MIDREEIIRWRKEGERKDAEKYGELKLCSHCGSRAKYAYIDHAISIVCEQCLASVSAACDDYCDQATLEATRAKIIENWNRRHIQEALEVLKEVDRFLDGWCPTA